MRREKKELAFLSSKILGMNFVRSPYNKTARAVAAPLDTTETLNQRLSSGDCPLTPGGFLHCSQEAPNLLLSYHFPVPFEGLVVGCTGHIFVLFGQRVLPDTQLCQREREKQKKEEMEEGRQDYGFRNHRICGLLYGYKVEIAHSPLRSEEIKYRTCISMPGKEERRSSLFHSPYFPLTGILISLEIIE